MCPAFLQKKTQAALALLPSHREGGLHNRMRCSPWEAFSPFYRLHAQGKLSPHRGKQSPILQPRLKHLLPHQGPQNTLNKHLGVTQLKILQIQHPSPTAASCGAFKERTRTMAVEGRSSLAQETLPPTRKGISALHRDDWRLTTANSHFLLLTHHILFLLWQWAPRFNYLGCIRNTFFQQSHLIPDHIIVHFCPQYCEK